MYRNALIILSLLAFCRSFAYACTERDNVDISQLKILLKSSNISKLDKNQRKIYDDNYLALVICPAQNLNNSNLTTTEKNNLKNILITEQLNGFEKNVAENMRFLDFEYEIYRYTNIYEAVYGKEKPLPTAVQQIIQNKEGYKADLKKNCSESYVDTTNMGPVRDQDDVGWCYAYSSADLISFHAKKTASAVDVAILYNNYSLRMFKRRQSITSVLQDYDYYQSKLAALGYTSLPKSEIKKQVYDSQYEGGLEEQALKVALQRGVCSEADLPSSNVSTNPNMSLKNKKESALQYKEKVELSHNSCSSYLPALQSLFTKLNMQDIDAVINRASPDRVLLGLRDANCKNTIRLPDKRLITVSAPDYSKLFSTLDAQLDKKQPVVFSYDYNLIEKNDPSAHSSIIVGRRFNEKTNKCEYKVRNSYGAKNHYEPSTGIKHVDGYFWVDQDRLKENIQAINALD